MSSRYKRGDELTEEFDIIGETADGMPVATKREEWYFLTDGEKFLSNGFDRIDSTGYYRYVAWIGTKATEVTLNVDNINFDSIEEITNSREML